MQCYLRKLRYHFDHFNIHHDSCIGYIYILISTFMDVREFEDLRGTKLGIPNSP